MLSTDLFVRHDIDMFFQMIKRHVLVDMRVTLNDHGVILFGRLTCLNDNLYQRTNKQIIN